MKNRRLCTAAAAVLFSLLLTLAFSVFSSSLSGGYFYKAATVKTEISPTDFARDYLGIELTDAEKEYFSATKSVLVSYNGGIPTSYVTTDYRPDTATLAVTAQSYTYTGENGAQVVWRPVSVSVDGQNIALATGENTATFYGVTGAPESRVEIKYTTEIKISASTVSYVIGLAPALIRETEEKLSEYERKLAEYEAAKEEYLEYLSALELYREYLSVKRIYDEAYSEYSEYLSELEEYNEKEEKYLKYLADKEQYSRDYATYLEYLAYADRNASKIEAYEKYQKDLDTVEAQLAIIKSVKKKSTDLKRTVYNAIMGDTVTSVIENKDAIANNITGADPKVVDMAGAATESLRSLLTDFFAIKDRGEQYRYYITNYEAFRDNFVNLFVSLDKLYMNSKVRGALIMQEKQEKYVILLAQLYYVATALSDTPVKNYDGTATYTDTYKVGKGYSDENTPFNILGEIYVLDTDNAKPLATGYPVEVEKPEFTTLTEPTMPEYVPMPIAPDKVDEPVAPTPVFEPARVEKPTSAPEPYTVPEHAAAVIEKYRGGQIPDRAHNTGDVTFTPEITVKKAYVNPQTVTVTYYSGEHGTPAAREPLYSVTVDRGTYADYLGPTPTKEEDAEYRYEFAGWTDKDTEAVDLSSVSTDLSLYPRFELIPKEYKSVWVVEGTVHETEPENPQKQDNGNLCYVFCGWDKESDPATATVTYTAEFTERYIVPVLGGGADVSLEDGNYVVKTQSYAKSFDLTVLLERAFGVGGIIIKTVSGDVSLSYSEVLKLREASARELELSIVKRSSGGYSFAVFVYDESGEVIENGARVTFKVPCDFDDPSHLIVYTEEKTEKKPVRSSYEGGILKFTATAGTVYYARVEYAISVVSTESVKIKADKSAAASGEGIKISVEVPNGILLNKIYYLTESGERVEIKDGEFLMPREDVSIGADYTVLEYTVSFVSDGKIIAEYKCTYGEVITPPTDPKKAADNKFTYTFVGWSDEVVPVCESVTYTAVYTAQKIDRAEDESLKITPSVLKIIVISAAIGATLILGVVPAAIMSIVILVRRKKKLSGEALTKRK